MNRHFPALRGIAIALVLVNHAITLSLQYGTRLHLERPTIVVKALLFALKQLGVMAVPVFLLLSGAFLVYAILGKDLATAYRITLASIKHVISPYLIWSLVFYIVMFFLAGERFSLVGYLKNLAVGYPFEFVPLLIFFYLIAPLLLRLAQKSSWGVMIAIAAYQVFLIAALNPKVFGLTLPGWTHWLTPSVLRIPLAVWGIFFPLGMVYSLHNKAFTAVVRRIWPVLLLLSLALYVFSILDQMGIVDLALAELLYPALVMFILPLIRRDWIPFASWFERLGKRAYALYLINLIMIHLALSLIVAIRPEWIAFYPLVALFAFLAALLPPLALMNTLERLSGTGRTAFRYVFG